MIDDQKTFVMQACKDRDIKFIRLWFTDILGSLKSFAITVEELEQAMDEGQGFDGSSIEGFARVDESGSRACSAISRCRTVRRSKATRASC